MVWSPPMVSSWAPSARSAVTSRSIVSIASLIGVSQLGDLLVDGYNRAIGGELLAGIAGCILLALVLVTIIGQGKYQIILILGILFIPSFARVVRGEVAKERTLNYVASARLMGASHLRIIFRHILPNTVQVLLPIVAIGFNNAVLAEASMSYLGVGVQPPDASLGRMLSEAQTYLGRAPWYALFVGLAIVFMILGLSLLTEGLQQRRRA